MTMYSLTLGTDGSFLFAPQVSSAPTTLFTADFPTQAFTVGGAVATKADIFAEFPAFWGNWDSNTEGGASGLTGLPGIATARLPDLIGGATYVITYDTTNLPLNAHPDFELMDTGFAWERIFKVVGGIDPNDSASLAFNDNVPYPSFPKGTVKAAVTLAPNHMALSINGAAIITNDYVADTPPTNLVFNIPTTGPILSITAYATKSDADLPALSA